jgi:penicillin-insensitive murein endopeptidase
MPRLLVPIALVASASAADAPDAGARPQTTVERSSDPASRERRPMQLDRRLGRYGAEHAPARGSSPVAISSYSVGTASTGALLNGQEMPLEGEAWRFIPSVDGRKTNFGTPQLIGGITRAAAAVRARWSDATMLVGNLSKKEGGDIVQSVSHNSGRDADVAFYVVDGDAESCTLDHFAMMDRNGKQVNCSGTQRFDPERNWAFVEALLTDPMVQVQWIFVSTPLRELLLEQATEGKADDELYRKAAAVLHQPRDSSPHADHFHIRVYCTRDDLLEGCINTGPIWDWVETWDADVRAHVKALLAELDTAAPQRQVELIETLARLRAQGASDKLRGLADSGSPDVRRAAFDALARLDPSALRPVLEKMAAHPEDPKLQRKAIRRLAYLGTTNTVPLLIRLLSSPERATRDEVRRALAHLTNVWLEPGRGKGSAVERLEKSWQGWYKKNRGESWAQWMRIGFEAKGVGFGGKMMRNRSIPVLIRTSGRTDHVGYNAQRVLTELTGHRVDPTQRSGDQARAYWQAWWKKNHKTYGFRRPTL